jgi:hypothetical protein
MVAAFGALDQAARQMAEALGKVGGMEAADAPGSPGAVEEVPLRELFFELLALGLANLYHIVPLSAPLFDRGMLKAVTGHLPDTESSKLIVRADDWIRLEGLVRGQEGQKSYSLSSQALAILSTETPDGSIGGLMKQSYDCYARQAHSPELRQATRRLAAVFLSMMVRS